MPDPGPEENILAGPAPITYNRRMSRLGAPPPRWYWPPFVRDFLVFQVTDMRRPLLLLLFLAFLLATCGIAEANWPQFRGGAAAGVSDAEGLPDTWDAAKNVAWSIDVPGKGWSSPVVWG